MSSNMKFNVLADFHHASLLQSLIMLFEGRLGGKVYRPIGLEWAEEGFWAIHDHPATRQQYLTLAQGYRPEDGTRPLNDIERVEDGVYYCQDIDSGRYNKAITLSKFMEMPIDIVIASIPRHIKPFKRLCELHKDKPKLIFQIGNAWSVEASAAPNVMASAIIENVPSNVNFVSYHQEFDLGVFKTAPPGPPSRIITSLVNCFNTDGLFAPDWALFQEVERLMPEWEFRCLGGQCRDGAAHGHAEVAKAIADSAFIWHTKNGGDGYGHIVFNTAAVGRPMITKRSYYAGKLGEKLMVDDVTCIDIDNLSPESVRRAICRRFCAESYHAMCRNVSSNFKKCVNFDEDEKNIRKFLDCLI